MMDMMSTNSEKTDMVTHPETINMVANPRYNL